MSASKDEDTDPLRGQLHLVEVPNKLYFTIGEVSQLTGVKAHVLRYWEGQFPSLANIQRRGKRRYYRREHVIAVRRIRRLLHEEGMTIKGAVHAVRQPREAADSAASPIARRELIEVRKVLEEISSSLSLHLDK